jgi:hypothetical protein
MTNQGLDLPLIPSPNVLTPDDGRDNARTLYCPSEADDPDYRAQIAAITGGIVDYFDTRVATPDAALLNTYDCVYTWANYAYLDNVLLGDRLADFVDGFGAVVLGAFCTYTSGNYLSGRIMTAGYSPVWSPSGSNHLGVTSYECTYRDYLAPQGGGVVDGHFTDGEIAGAWRPDKKVYYNNGAGALQLGCTGQWPLLVANSCGCSVIPPPPPPVPVEETSWGQIKAWF